MANIKQIGMAAGTFSVALGIGFIMQNGNALASRFGADTAAEQPAVFTETQSVDAVIAAPQMPDSMLPEAVQSAQASVAFSIAPSVQTPDETISSAVVLPDAARVPTQQETPVQLATLDAEIAPEAGTEASVSVEIDCVPVMATGQGAAATVEISVTAPCHIAESFTIHHQGMMFTATTDEDGSAELTVPALAEVSVLIAAFANGDGAVSTATVPDFSDYDRAVLQWQGDTSVMLSAYEGGADFGDASHIHASNPGTMARLNAAEGGYLVRLGDTSNEDALIAEVYTFPTGTIGDRLEVMLVAEAEITADNCGQELNAQSIQVSPTGQTSALDLKMIMPDCGAVGDFLILQNMFEDLTLASR